MDVVGAEGGSLWGRTLVTILGDVRRLLVALYDGFMFFLTFHAANSFIPKVPNLSVFLHKVQQASNLLCLTGFNQH